MYTFKLRNVSEGVFALYFGIDYCTKGWGVLRDLEALGLQRSSGKPTLTPEGGVRLAPPARTITYRIQTLSSNLVPVTHSPLSFYIFKWRFKSNPDIQFPKLHISSKSSASKFRIFSYVPFWYIALLVYFDYIVHCVSKKSIQG